ncbi:uncharacterized protein ATNIH1004_007125 [Aspergillus tanneri]|uniref:Uncharacterized protein n=1 Tax=Aspergillus tanneri TaxID=1220188 RepID=A0A5M9MIM1_9EURO|nr:uncharacterized protein ATNIH1004_007125 [Aspergillus tanneri]KAA8645706.1 hypothetical protein ATNIH1004_007125 [Aspergillus tanneri]
MSEVCENVSHLEAGAETASSRIEELSANLNAARKELEDKRLQSQEMASRQSVGRITRTHPGAKTNEWKIIRSRRHGLEFALEQVTSLEQEVSRLQGRIDENQKISVQKDEEIGRLLASKENAES